MTLLDCQIAVAITIVNRSRYSIRSYILSQHKAEKVNFVSQYLDVRYMPPYDLVRKDLLLGVTFHSFLALGKASNKNRESPGFRTLSTACFLRSSAISSRNNGEDD